MDKHHRHPFDIFPWEVDVGKRESWHVCKAPELADKCLRYGLWASSLLEIDWDPENSLFKVYLTAHLNLPQDEDRIKALCSDIPVHIAKESQCACGSALTLGPYSVKLTDGDYELTAEYYCSKCKATSKQRNWGIGSLIKQTLGSLKRINISASGIDIERKLLPNKRVQWTSLAVGP